MPCALLTGDSACGPDLAAFRGRDPRASAEQRVLQELNDRRIGSETPRCNRHSWLGRAVVAG